MNRQVISIVFVFIDTIESTDINDCFKPADLIQYRLQNLAFRWLFFISYKQYLKSDVKS